MSIWLLPGIPAAGAALVAALAGRRRLCGPVAVAAALATLAAALVLVTAVHPPAFVWCLGPGLSGRLALEGFGRVMVALVPLVAAAVLAYAARAEDGGDLPRLLAWLLLFVAAMELLAAAGDLLILLVAWELVGVCSWTLIGHHYRDPHNPRAATRAFLTTRFGDLGLYLAAAATYAGAGSLDFAALGRLQGPLAHVVAGGLLLAAAAKSAQVPFSPWLFEAMAGPTPVSALLHSATMVAAGAYALLRLEPVLAHAAWWLAPATALVGAVTVLAGGVVAALQDDLKKALAASTSSQYGLMFVAIGAGSAAAAGAHLVAHAAFKALLFLGAGVAIHAAGSGRLDGMRLGRSLPAAAALFGVGAAALAAVPPLGAAWTKEAVVAAAFHGPAPLAPWLGAAILGSGILTAFYAARLALLAFGPGPAREVRRPSAVELAALAVLAFTSVALAALWFPAARGVVASLARGEVLSGGGWERLTGLALIAIAAEAAWQMARRGRLVGLGLGDAARTAAAAWLALPRLARAAVIIPVDTLARRLAAVDDRVVDAGVRLAAAVGRGVSKLLSGGVEPMVDRVVALVSGSALAAARGSRVLDDEGIDGAVEGIGRSAGRAGAASRSVQGGMAHRYYAIIAGGTAAVLLLVILLPLLGHALER